MRDYLLDNEDPFFLAGKDYKSSQRVLTASCEYMFSMLTWKSEWNKILSGYKIRKNNKKNNFKNDSLYFLRLRDLKNNYDFGGNPLRDFTKTSEDHKTIVNYDYETSMKVFRKIGSTYFPKLCVSYESLKNR